MERHEGSLNKQSLENYLHRLSKRLIGLSDVIRSIGMMETKEQDRALEFFRMLIEHEAHRVSEIWRSLCTDCSNLTVRELYRADDNKEVESS